MSIPLGVQLLALALVVIGVAMVAQAGWAVIVGGLFLLWIGKRMADERQAAAEQKAS